MAVLLSPVGLLIISATRLLIVSNYNTTTATAIASSGGYVNTLLGTVMPLVPLALPYLGVIFLLYRRLLLSLLIFGSAALVSPARLAPLSSTTALDNAWHGYRTWVEAHYILILVTFIVLLIFALFATKEWREDFRREAVRSVHREGKSFQQAAEEHGIKERLLRSWAQGGTGGAGAAIFLAVLASSLILPYVWNIYPIPRTIGYYSALISQPWLPAERITVGSDALVIGYTLSASDTWVIILDARTRTIRYVPAADVTGRLVCQLNSEHLIASNPSPLVPLSTVRTPQLPSCWSSGSPGGPSTPPELDASKWTTVKIATSSAGFRHVTSLSQLAICAINQVSATLSVEISGGPAGFRIQIDRGPLMRPGAVRFVPAGPHDTFSFTFIERVNPFRSSDHHTFAVEWRSPIRKSTTLERATLNLQYQRGIRNC